MDFIKVLLGYAVSCFLGYFMIRKAHNPAVCFIGYNLVVVPVGAVVSICTYGMSMEIVYRAIFTTAVVTLSIIVIATLFPGLFAGLGRILFVSLLAVILTEFVLIFIGIPLSKLDWVVALIFCGFIGFDWARANAKEKTLNNAVDSAAEIYLDIINLFLRILSIFGRRR